MKRLTLLIALLLVLSLVACTVEAPQSTPVTSAAATPTAGTSAPTAAATTSAEPAPLVNKEGWPIVNEPTTLKVMGPKGALHIDWQEMDLFIWLSEKTNLQFEFNTPPVESFSEKKTLAFASNDLPDLFLGGSFTGEEVVRYGVQQELLVKFEDYRDYAPNIFKAYEDYPDIYASQLAENGYSYSSGYITNTFWMPTIRHLFINKVWMDQIGQTTPTTIDEYLELLRAYKAAGDLNGNGENDEIVLGLSSSSGDLSSLRSSILGAFGLLTDTFEIERGTGKVIFAPLTESFKEYLRYMNIFWSEGMIDIDAFSQSSADYRAKAAAGRYASFSSNSALMVTETYIHDYEMVTPLISDMNKEPLDYNNSGFTPGHGVITTSSKYPEAAMRLLDWMYTEEGMLSMNYGPNNWVILDNGAHAFLLADGTTGVDHAYRSTLTMGYGVGIPMNARAAEESFRAYVSDTENNYLNSITYSQIVVHALPFTYNPTPSVIMTEEERENAISMSDLKKYVSQMEAKFIIGELDIDADWDTFVAGCQSIDLELLQKTYEGIYGRYMENIGK